MKSDDKLSGKRVRSTVAAARKSRRNMSDVEQTLWNRIRDKQIDEFRFRRQRPMGRYIVDFVCVDAKLIVELDDDQTATDAKRAEFLESLGFSVVRFKNDEVVENMNAVLEQIRARLKQYAESNPVPAFASTRKVADRDSAGAIASASPAKLGRRVRDRLAKEDAASRNPVVVNEDSEGEADRIADSELPAPPAQATKKVRKAKPK
jgi:very-short-patch-repair endonuclease